MSGIYIHWPFCKSKCPYCDFNSHVRESVEQGGWLAAYKRELGFWAERLGKRRLESVFFGGGTPSLMEPSVVGGVIEEVARKFTLAADAEITLEANPTSVEAAGLSGMKAAGINRVSLGVQALSGEALKFLGREHSAGEAVAALKTAAGIFDNYSFDLIYALPGQKASAWREELSGALSFGPRHISLYQLTIEEGTKFQNVYNAGGFALPSEDEAAELYELTQEITRAEGLPRYEVSNHAAPGFESRHNLNYWNYGEYIGIGPGAHGRVDMAGKIAVVNIRSPEKWLEAVEEKGRGIESETPLSPLEQEEEALMMGMRLIGGVETAKVKEAVSQSALSRLADGGFIEITGGFIRATEKGNLALGRVVGEMVL